MSWRPTLKTTARPMRVRRAAPPKEAPGQRGPGRTSRGHPTTPRCFGPRAERCGARHHRPAGAPGPVRRAKGSHTDKRLVTPLPSLFCAAMGQDGAPENRNGNGQKPPEGSANVQPERSTLREWWKRLEIQHKIAIVVPVAVGLLGTGGAIAVAILSKSGPEAKRGPAVSIDGLSVLDRKSGAQIVDLQVRNSGDQIAYLRRARFTILAARSIRFCPPPFPKRVSYSYAVRLPHEVEKFPTTVEKRIDQVVRRDDADRFRFVLGTDGNPPLGSTIYQVQMTLIYNQSERVDPELLVLRLRKPWRWLAFSTGGLGATGFDAITACQKRNVQNVLAMTNLPGTRSRGLSELAVWAGSARQQIARYEAGFSEDPPAPTYPGSP
jgi:hypothetical protein